MKNHQYFARNFIKILTLELCLLFLPGFGLLFAQTNDIQPMEEFFPELKRLFNTDADGIEIPHSKQNPSNNLLDGLELPPQKPRNKWKFDE
jgi:hypothetical protein